MKKLIIHPILANYPPKCLLSSSEVTPEALRVHQSQTGILGWKRSLSQKAKFLEPECFLEPGGFGALPAEHRQRFPWKASCMPGRLPLLGFQGPQIQGFSITWSTLDPCCPPAPRIQVQQLQGLQAPHHKAGSCRSQLGVRRLGILGKGRAGTFLVRPLNQIPWFPSPNLPSKAHFEMSVLKQRKGTSPHQVP